MSEWQPIETAPKDGTRIRVKCDEATPGFDEATGFWSNGHWACSMLFTNAYTRMLIRYPTHWMPLSEEPRHD